MNGRKVSDLFMVAVGTHPTLAVEPIVTIGDYVFNDGHSASPFRIQNMGIFGITYKCGIFPEMCHRNTKVNEKGDPVDPENFDPI